MDVRLKRRSKRGNLSEFPVAMLVFFMFFVFPLLNLFFFGVASGTVAFITTQAVGSAAQQSSFTNALTAMQTTTQNLTNTNWGKFAKIAPQGGYNGSGADLYVVETPIGGGASNYYGPNNISNLNPQPQTFIYEYRVRTNYSVTPFLNLASVPFIGGVPLIGQNANLSWNVERSVEMSYGQNFGTNNGGGADPFGTPPNGSPNMTGGPPLTGSTQPPSAPPTIQNPVTPITPFGIVQPPANPSNPVTPVTPPSTPPITVNPPSTPVQPPITIGPTSPPNQSPLDVHGVGPSPF